MNDDAVRKLRIVQLSSGKFIIYVKVTWSSDEFLLENQRRKPRVWSSLDRLTSHLASNVTKLPLIELYLNNGATTNATQKKSTRDKSME